MKLKNRAIEVQENLGYILEFKKSIEEKIVQIQALGLVEEKVTQGIIISRFSAVLTQNEDIIERNKNLKNQIIRLEEQLSELEELRAEKRAKEKRKEARANRKRLPRRDPMTAEIYKKLLQAAEGPAYIDVRLRIAICFLTITGIRINELLPLKVYQLQTLVEEGWIAINRSKRGSANHKAFLTKEGKNLVKDRQKDFQFIFLMKEPDSYVFTNESNHSKY